MELVAGTLRARGDLTARAGRRGRLDGGVPDPVLDRVRRGDAARRRRVFGFPVRLSGIPPALAVACAWRPWRSPASACCSWPALLAFKSSAGRHVGHRGAQHPGRGVLPGRLFPGWIRWVSEVQPFTPARRPAASSPARDHTGPEPLAGTGQARCLQPGADADLRRGAHVRRQVGPAARHPHGVLAGSAGRARPARTVSGRGAREGQTRDPLTASLPHPTSRSYTLPGVDR